MNLSGLYVVTPTPADATSTGVLTEQVSAALAGGARIVQYRDKTRDAFRRRERAAALAALCRRRGVPLIVNDDVDLALAVAADGVHLGRDDCDPGTARRLLGAARLIGVSCYNDFDLALAAVDAGADYVAFGSFYPSPSKPRAVRADPDLLRRGRRTLPTPVVAIGGITPENGAALLEAGADALAVVSAVFGQTDIRAAARRFANLFDRTEDPHP